MEQWEIEFYWLKVRHQIRDSFKVSVLPDLDTLLFLIGIQELGMPFQKFSKEEKIDLIKLAIATLLQDEGYFSFTGKILKGWPEFVQLKEFDITKKESEQLMKIKIIHYFEATSDDI